ncbi:hypothetical protein REC12_19365 [Desulfosporosinus sp. PR]|uniref:hypothetical protein n=1 Tax=Candidatus Desulfosporosinus nitrosoreducens TaxID=3401928 RepID=UPI0027FBBE24|nr:hypothetical protein [Desulfosporosinus sp. PR]MDQ7095754.1 hypothetical protein [Desulfosporosinus sp. PR]
MNNDSMTGQQNSQSAREFEQKAQEAASGEQKARNFNAQNSGNGNNQQGQFQSVSQQASMKGSMFTNTMSGQQDWQMAQDFEQKAQQAAQGEQKADSFNAQHSDR